MDNTPGVYCEICGECILAATPIENDVFAEDIQPAMEKHKQTSGHEATRLFLPTGTFIRYTH